MLISVTGATGFVGTQIVEQLLRRDHAVRVLARDQSLAGWMRDRGVEVVEGELGDPAALTRLAQGAGAMIHLVGIIEEIGRQTFQRIHIDGTRAVVEASRAAGVVRFVHMSALGARSDASATAYHRSKAQAEEIVRGSGISHAIMRPSLVAAPGNAVLGMLLNMLRFSPVVPIIGDGLYKLQPVAGDDVAEAFSLAVERPDTAGVFELGGPEQLTYHQLLDQLEDALGVKRRRVPVPVALARAGAMGGSLVPMLAPITTAQLQMLLEGSTTESNALVNVFGITPRPFKDVAVELCAPYVAPAAAP